MTSTNLQTGGGGGDGYKSPELSEAFSLLFIKIATGQSGELSPPVVSVTSPVEESLLSCPIQEQIENASTDRCPPETAISFDDSGTGCQDEGSDGDGGGNAVKNQVWSKLSIAAEVVSPIMGAASWPALGESTKAAHKSSSSESLQTLSVESLLPALQVTGNSSSSSHKPASENPASTPNYITSSEQRSMRGGGGLSGTYSSSNRMLSQPSPKSQESKVESSGTPATDLSSYPKDHTYKQSPIGGFGSQLNGGNDHHYQRISYRRGNGGLHARRGGSYHHNYGGKLDQGRGRGNQHRNFNRDTNIQPHRGSYHRGGYIRPLVHNSTPFTHPQMVHPLQPFGNNVLYPGPAPPIVRGPFYYPVQDTLHVKIVKQIDYYFSNDNLVKDTYLRRHMDEQGWVPVNLIAGFNKVSSLTDSVQLILDVMQKSTVVEVQGDKMRRRNDWMRWLIPSFGSQLQDIQMDGVFSSR